MTTTTQTKTQVRFTADEFKSMEWIITEYVNMWYTTTDLHPDCSVECDDIIKQAKNYRNIVTKLNKKSKTPPLPMPFPFDDLITEMKELKIEFLKNEKEEKKKEEAKAKLIEKQKSFKADKELLIKKLADIAEKKAQKKLADIAEKKAQNKKAQKKKFNLVIVEEAKKEIDEDEECFCGTTYVDEECDYCKNKENDGEVSDGRYAIYIKEKLRFFKIQKGKGKYKNCTFVSEIIGGGDFGSKEINSCRNPVFRDSVLLMITNDKGANKRYSDELQECHRCGRELTDELSRKTGLGPTCRAQQACGN